MKSVPHTRSKRQAEAASLSNRQLLSVTQANELASIFKLLSSETRLRMLHALARAGEMSVADLADEVEMTPQAVSNQLQRLVDRRALATRRDRNNIFYRIADPCIPALLHFGWCTAESGLPSERTRVLASV